MTLHCPATLLVARHGQADYPEPDVLSDHGGWLTDLGRRQSLDLAEQLRNRRVAMVWSSPLERAVQTSGLVAEALDVPRSVAEGLHEFEAADLAGRAEDDPTLRAVFDDWLAGRFESRIPGGESGAEVISRYRRALGEIADQHRGETVVVVSHGGVMSFCLPRLASNVSDDLAAQRPLPNCALAEVEVGDNGDVVVRSWPGSGNLPVA